MTPHKADVAAAICAASFIVILGVATYWDRSIRVLHVFESIPYLLAAVLSLRRRKIGYALGVVSGAFFLWTAGFLTTFIRNGFDRLGMLLRSGSVDRPDVLLAVPGAVATAGLVLTSLMGYWELPNKSRRDWAVFGAAVAVVPTFFIAILAAFAPRYLEMFRGLLNIW